MWQIAGKNILVVGAGVSGLAAAEFLNQKKAYITITDQRTRDQLSNRLDGLEQAGVKLALGDNLVPGPGEFDFLVVSPGVPLSVAPLAAAHRLGLPVWGELELAYGFARAPIVAITGTNGKTTTTALLGSIFQAAGYKTLVGGNIGQPLIEKVEEYGERDLIVAEVSSFQLETTGQFRPRVAVITNLSPDHLDRHGSMEQYIKAKAKIMANQTTTDIAILNYDDDRVRELARCTRGQVIFFSRRHILETGMMVVNHHMVARFNNREEIITDIRRLPMPGSHNLENCLAASMAALVMGVPPTVLDTALLSFTGVAHRLETVAEINGVKYVNDSKGTNPEASIKALTAFEQPLILLAGGRNKGNDFTALATLIKEKVRVLVVLGECADEIAKAAKGAGCNNILQAPDFRQAATLAHQNARPGEVVLLSPACASWDMFKSFEERGDLFRQLVRDFKC